jgi:hypothetical protein
VAVWLQVSAGIAAAHTEPTPNSPIITVILPHALLQIFDAHKRLLYTGDAVPDEVALAKGEHTARLLLRHDDRALLEKLKGTCLVSARRHCIF